MMKDMLHAPVPDFDQPIAVLKHCHDKIRKQLGTLQRLLAHLPEFGANVDAQQAAQSVLRYFDNAAENHHADEEENLLPMLKETARGDDAALLQQLAPGIQDEHRQMDAIWQSLRGELKDIAGGVRADLSAEQVKRFSDMYTAHMEREEAHIAPMAKRLFSDAQMAQLGDAMRERRGVAQ